MSVQNKRIYINVSWNSFFQCIFQKVATELLANLQQSNIEVKTYGNKLKLD